MKNITLYAQNVLDTAKTFKGKEREQYVLRKIEELDENIELGLLLGTPVKWANKALEEIFEHEVLTADKKQFMGGK